VLAQQPTGQLRSQHKHTKQTQTNETKTKAQHTNNNTLHGAGFFLI